ncbi:SMI1/KNR4 family protein [Leucobacter coleopterorum]|uniref:SMI1/KNR4 family protein n=1 Tax=Leucobacter coleopterorum TaxID=2714933 RepID=A0ABX6JT85_9MICO|nr:SMI1/KNR4 family protein [Leucobacter coleopterorum]QIM17502.1 SMI1/KNR4 family protein [Leucobacter coleopterorum]
MINLTAEHYVSGLKDALTSSESDEASDELAALKLATGATPEDITKITALYPNCPRTLLDLLRRVDGTYWREYFGQTIAVFFLGSDVYEYPYYLLSAAQIVESGTDQLFCHDSIRDVYGDKLDAWLPEGRGGQPGGGYRDDRIDPDLPRGRRLHFSDCMNNGGTSQLFIDFDPVGEGKVGQIVRYLHDPDSYAVIADSFEEYLQHLMDQGFGFLNALE